MPVHGGDHRPSSSEIVSLVSVFINKGTYANLSTLPSAPLRRRGFPEKFPSLEGFPPRRISPRTRGPRLKGWVEYT